MLSRAGCCNVGKCADTCDGLPELLARVLETLLVDVAGPLLAEDIALYPLEMREHVFFELVEPLVEGLGDVIDMFLHPLLERLEICCWPGGQLGLVLECSPDELGHEGAEDSGEEGVGGEHEVVKLTAHE